MVLSPGVLRRAKGSSFAPPDIKSTSFENGGWDTPFADISGVGNEVIVADATAVGGHSLQLNWASGAEMSAGAECDFHSSFGTTQLCFLRFRLKQSVGFDNSGIKKICRFQGAGFNGIFGTLIINQSAFDFVWDGDSQDNVPSVTPNPLRGAWHYYELMNDVRTSPYHAKMWVDGSLVMDVTTAFTYGTAPQIGACDVCGIFNSPAANGTEWIDEIAISTQRIGP